MGKMFDDLVEGLGEVDAFLNEGKRVGFKAHIPNQIDVRRIRGKLHLTQSKFSDLFGFSLNAVKHWEAGRRTPESSARALLTVIDKAPEVVITALQGRAAIKTVYAKRSAKQTGSAKHVTKTKRVAEQANISKAKSKDRHYIQNAPLRSRP